MATQLQKNGTDIIYEQVILDLTSDLLDTMRSINAHLAIIAENTNNTASKGGK